MLVSVSVRLWNERENCRVSDRPEIDRHEYYLIFEYYR